MGKILIGADLVPTKSNYELFENEKVGELFGEELIHFLAEADFRIFNLETPLCDKITPIDKAGPTLRTPTAVAKCFTKIGVNLFSLANNHILDQGKEGIKSTKNILNLYNIPYVGIGSNLKNANVPYVFELNGKKYGVYSCAEHEFSIATEKTMGANPYDPIDSFDHVRELKNETDYIIVLFHGGKEYFRYPTPGLQRICRKFIDCGAKLVVCQHSHCIGCEEVYGNGTIVYGQGNFLFDDSEDECWQTGLLIEITDDNEIKYHPLRKHKNVVRMASKQDKKEILREFNERSIAIQKKDFVSENYSEFVQKYRKLYLLSLIGINTQGVRFRILNKLTKYKYENYLINKHYQKKKKLRVKNYINCETHREILLELLK